jgi:hypothetical protein
MDLLYEMQQLVKANMNVMVARGLEMAEDGGGARWHSDDVEDDQVLTFIPSSHMKVFQSQGRLPSTIYSGHI